MPHMQLMQRPPKPTDTRQTLIRQPRTLRQHQTPDLGRVGNDRFDGLIRQLGARSQVEDPEMVELPHPVGRRVEDLARRRRVEGRAVEGRFRRRSVGV